MKTLVLKIFVSLLRFTFPDYNFLSSEEATTPTFISVSDFGAAGDGVRYDTLAIQSAINSCPTEPSACYITFPSGAIYLTSTIYLNRSNVFLDVQPGAVLLGGTRLEDYHPTDREKWYVVLAEDVDNVGVTGGGVIDGQGSQFVEEFNDDKNVMVSWNWTGACVEDECRPRLIGFVGCTNVRVWNITLRNPAYWCLNIFRCRGTLIDDVTILGDFNTPNNDGIDIDGSNDTTISRCRIDTGDDAICPKTSTGPLYNLTVSDCWIKSKSSAIKFGSGSTFNFQDALFNNISIVDSHRGIGFQNRDGGNTSNITFANMNISTRYYHPSWWGRSEPVYVTNCPRNPNASVGSVSNLLFTNISANSENGIFLSGCDGGLLKNVRFVNIDVTYTKKTNYTGKMADYRPGCQGLVNHTTAGIVMEFIDDAEFENVIMNWPGYKTDLGDVPMHFKSSTVRNIKLLNFSSRLFPNN